MRMCAMPVTSACCAVFLGRSPDRSKVVSLLEALFHGGTCRSKSNYG